MRFNRRSRCRGAGRIKYALVISMAVIMMVFGMTACSRSEAANTGDNSGSATVSDSADVTIEDLASIEIFTDRDLEGDYDESEATKIALSKTVTIDEEGVYILSGSIGDGQVVVDADDSAKIQIVLDGVDISNSSGAAIYVKSANKVFITLADGSENSLKVSGAYDSSDNNNVDSVIFAKSDLTLNGSGKLTVTAEYGHGIVSKDDLVISGGEYEITAEKKALDANNSVRIADGTFTLEAGTDGIHAADTDKDVGFVYIKDGIFTIKAGDDAIHAHTDLLIDNGEMTVSKCYEGLEGNTVIVNGGTIDVTSDDDGLNAAGGNDSSGEEGGGSDMFATEEDAIIQINGGTIHVSVEGDGLDSNGSLEITGGSTSVEGPSNDGNGSIDIGGSGTAVITGGTFIAAGSSGMAENFSEDSTQGAILATVNSTTGTAELKDSDGNVLASIETDKQYTCVQVSTPDIDKGETYTLTAGGSDTTIEMDSLIYGNSGMGSGSPGGGQPGGRITNDKI